MIAKKLLTTIAFAFVLLFSGCAEDDFDGVDGLCPLVVSTVPEDGAIDVPLNQVITATFNEKMNPSTITGASFTVSANGSLINGTVTYTDSTAVFTPSSLLDENTEYTGTITTLAKDLRGNALQENYVWSFVTVLPLPEYTVDVSSNPIIGGLTAGGGIFEQGTTVTVTAVPNAGYTFTNWTENEIQVSTSANYQFVIIGDRTLVANYTLIPPTQFAVSLSSNPVEGGSTTGSGSYDEGTNVTVTAAANTGYDFVNWTLAGVQVSTNANYTFALNADTALVANFKIKTYTLQVIAENGTVLVNPEQVTYDYGTTVVLMPTADPDYSFTSWTGDATGNDKPLTVIMTGNKIITANFALNQFEIVLSANPLIGGTTNGAGSFGTGSTRTVTATANEGYTFTNWTENGVIVPGAGASYQFVLTKDRTLVANFTLNQFDIVLSANPLIGGTTNGAGTFDTGSTRTVTATANSGYTFTNWTENGVIVPGAGASYQFVLIKDRTLVANFTLDQFNIVLSANPLIGGNTNGAGTFDTGSTRTVTAIANAGYTFNNWTENGVIVSGAGAIYEFVLIKDRTLVANFTLDQFNIVLSANPLIGGTTNGAGTFDTGSTRTVTAIANSGYTFTNWTENGVIVTGAGANYQFVLTKDRTLVANFTLNQFNIVLSSNPLIGGNTNGAGTFDKGSTRTVTAIANSGYSFTYWTENGTVILGVGASYQFVLIKDRTLVANFTAVVLPPPTNAGLCPSPAVDLGLARNYAILAETGISATIAGPTSITGDMGISPGAATLITGFDLILDSSGTYSTSGSTSNLVTGKIYAADYTAPTPTNVGTAVDNRQTAFTTANGLAPNSTEYLGGNLNNVTLTAGVYKYGTDLNLFNTITLDGGGVDCAAFVFQIKGKLIVANGTKIILTNGAKADNIFWVVAGSGANLGTTVQFEGNILSQTLISVNTGSSVNGRLLAKSAVTLNANTVVMPSN